MTQADNPSTESLELGVNLPEEKKEPKPFQTKDRWTIITMRVCGHVPDLIESVTREGNRVLMYHFPVTAWTDYDAYMRGEPILVKDIRLVEQSEREFKNNLHRFARY
jgi:hypothetical protein